MNAQQAKHGVVFGAGDERKLGPLEYRPAAMPVTDVDGRQFTVGLSMTGTPLVTDVATGRRWGITPGALLALARAEGLCEPAEVKA